MLATHIFTGLLIQFVGAGLLQNQTKTDNKTWHPTAKNTERNHYIDTFNEEKAQSTDHVEDLLDDHRYDAARTSRKILKWFSKIVGSKGTDTSEMSDVRIPKDILRMLMNIALREHNLNTVSIETNTNDSFFIKLPIRLSNFGVSNRSKRSSKPRESNNNNKNVDIFHIKNQSYRDGYIDLHSDTFNVEKSHTTDYLEDLLEDHRNDATKTNTDNDNLRIHDVHIKKGWKETNKERELNINETKNNVKQQQDISVCNTKIPHKTTKNSKLLGYVQDSSDEIKAKVDSIKNIRTALSKNPLFATGYLIANVDNVGETVNTIQKSNKNDWDADKLFQVLDMLKERKKVVDNVLSHLPKFVTSARRHLSDE